MKRTKKVLSIILTVVMVVGMLPMTQIAELDLSVIPDFFVKAFAADVVASGSCGEYPNHDDVTWQLDGDGVLTISGTGKMSSHFGYDAIHSEINKLVVESGVTNVVDRQFQGC